MKYPFRLEKKKIIVLPKIKGKNGLIAYEFILDTGASISIMSDTTAAILGFDLKKLNTDNFVSVGGKITAKTLNLPQIELFGKTIENFPVSIMSMPLQITTLADGLIGMDFLTKFNSLKIDFETQTIEI